MSAEETATLSATIETQDEFAKTPKDYVGNWLTAIEIAGKDEKDWREAAEAALAVYRSEKGKAKSYNILFANTQTKLPALYNSEPSPDVRRRFGDSDPIGQGVAQALERALTVEAEMNDFDAAMEAAVSDMELQGRGVTRVRVNVSASGLKSISCEPVIWDDFRRGPAKRWEDVPWVAFRWRMTREELNDLNPQVGPTIDLDVAVEERKGKDSDDSDDTPDIFKRATVWEIWDRLTRRVIFIAEQYKDAPLQMVQDPYKLRQFLPVPKPLYALKSTTTLEPVCPFTVWKKLAEEIDNYTARIASIVKVMKMRGLFDGSFEGALKKLENLDDGELAPLEDAQRAVNQGGLDKAVWLWPVDQAIKVVQGLYEAREQCKAAIYEITGVADILRGQTDANETLGAQQIKAQWGSLRLQDAQRAVQRYARDLYRMVADLMAEVLAPEEWAMRIGGPLAPEMLAMLKSDIQREFSIEIETDSTIRADLSRAQQNVAGFVTGMGEFIQSVGPAVQAGMMPAPIAVKLLRTFARNFKLGREADVALDEWEKMLTQQAQQPPQPDPKAQAEEAKKQAIMLQAQTDMAQTQMQAQRDQQKHGMEMQKLGAQVQAEQIRAGLDQQALQAEVMAAHAMPQQPRTVQ